MNSNNTLGLANGQTRKHEVAAALDNLFGLVDKKAKVFFDDEMQPVGFVLSSQKIINTINRILLESSKSESFEVTE